MNITIIAGGSRGDVQPYVALGKGFREAGHGIRILAAQDFQDLITSHGLEFVAMSHGVEAIAQEQFKAIAEQGNVLKILASTGRGAQQMAYQAAVLGLEACQGSDLIVGGVGGLFVGLALSEKLGIPFLQAYVFPLTPTRAFPSVLVPVPQTWLTRWANGLSHRMTQQMMWQMFRAADSIARSRVLALAPAPFWGPFATLRRQTQPILYGYSRHVVPPPSDWASHIHVTGSWFLAPPPGWEPPAEVVAFLRSGPPPVYIGFGSMPNSQPEAIADLIVQALARVGQRGLLAAGWGGLKKAHLPEHVLMIDALPHDWLFPQMTAVVHHGGAGTTAAGIRAGVPSIITPFFGDQPFWGRQVYALGVGPQPIPRQRLTIDRLAEALRCAVSDTAMRTRAAALGEQVRAEQGVVRAVTIVEQYYGRG